MAGALQPAYKNFNPMKELLKLSLLILLCALTAGCVRVTEEADRAFTALLEGQYHNDSASGSRRYSIGAAGRYRFPPVLASNHDP